MPEWAISLLSVVGAAGGAYAAIRIELRFLWRDIEDLRTRVERLELRHHPGRRWNDRHPSKVRSD